MYELIPVFENSAHSIITNHMKEALGCPECGAGRDTLLALSENRSLPRYLITCRECKYHGPFGRSLPGAIKQWNKPLSLFAHLKKKWTRRKSQVKP